MVMQGFYQEVGGLQQRRDMANHVLWKDHCEYDVDKGPGWDKEEVGKSQRKVAQ